MNFPMAQIWESGWPQITLLIAAFVCLATSVTGSKRGLRFTVLLAAVAFLVCAWGFLRKWSEGSSRNLNLLIFDPFGNFLGILICLIGLAAVLFSFRYWQEQDEVFPETIPLFLFCTLGMTLMVTTAHLLTLVLGLELMSLCLYILVGIRRSDPKGVEASFKYFLLGSVAAAFLLLGVSFLYGSTGVLDVNQMALVLIPPEKGIIFQLGALLVLLGFAFKVAAVPLHFWAPDVYDGAPAPVTGFMATGVKVAAFGALIRILQAFFRWEILSLPHLLAGFSLATMVVGNLTALRQKSLKRIMAYSSISHAGYLLLGLTTLVPGGQFRTEALSPILYYLVVYGLLTLGVFAILTWLSGEGREIGDLSELNGLASTHPMLAAVLSIFLISLAGIPPSAGFLAKYFIFAQAIHLGLYPLAVVGILASVISLYYYLGPVIRMYFNLPQGERTLPEMGPLLKGVVALMVLAVFYLGIFPARPLKMVAATKILAPLSTVKAGVP